MRAVSRRDIAVPAAITAGLLASGMLVWHSSYAAFTASTSNTLQAGKVTLTDNDSGVALFTPGFLAPTDSDVKCIDVTYAGNIAANVTFAAKYNSADPSSPLAPYLTFTVDRIDPATTCTAGAAAVETLSTTNETLAGLVTRTATTGIGTWAASSTQTRRYRFSYSLKDDTNAQNLTAKVDLVWTSKSTAGA